MPSYPRIINHCSGSWPPMLRILQKHRSGSSVRRHTSHQFWALYHHGKAYFLVARCKMGRRAPTAGGSGRGFWRHRCLHIRHSVDTAQSQTDTAQTQTQTYEQGPRLWNRRKGNCFLFETLGALYIKIYKLFLVELLYCYFDQKFDKYDVMNVKVCVLSDVRVKIKIIHQVKKWIGSSTIMLSCLLNLFIFVPLGTMPTKCNKLSRS